ncbi:MAG: peptidoglycan DD-metalloendopeptidase family protein [Candidatus Margulisbacteria bacterium]|nr:peptidoglycan DD-metalloendopeptidase family protein [Candidatus Margulisiibacteriota bacterium]
MRPITVMLAVLLIAGVARAESLDEQEKLKLIQKELKTSQEKLKLTKEQKQEVLGKLVVITQELKKANRSLNKAKEKIQANESKIGELVVEQKKTEEDLSKKSGKLELRVREAFKNGGLNYLDLLFASQSMSDFLNRLYFFEKVIARDASLIMGVREDLRATRSQQQQLTGRTREIKELAQVIAENKKKIAEQADEKKKVFEELKVRESEYAAKIAELEKSSRELEVMIQRKMAERSRSGQKIQSTGELVWPLKGRITLRFGARHRLQGRHTGIDIAAPYGSPIVAADSGEIIFAGWWDGYGKAVVIDHGKGRATVYAHMSRIYPTVGALVAKGQTIGLEGTTGYSTGPHCHFEVRINGVPTNPEKFLP